MCKKCGVEKIILEVSPIEFMALVSAYDGFLSTLKSTQETLGLFSPETFANSGKVFLGLLTYLREKEMTLRAQMAEHQKKMEMFNAQEKSSEEDDLEFLKSVDIKTEN